MVKVKEDLTGKAFGNLTVMKQDEDYINTNGKHSPMWLCLCKCGNIKSVLGKNLKSGATTSCGQNCKNKGIDLIGQRFGRLIVRKNIGTYKYPSGKKECKWLCECDCGNFVEVGSSNLQNGHTQSCGCYYIESHKKANAYEIVDDYVVMYTSKGEPFYVDLEDFNKVKEYTWHLNSEGYVCSEINGVGVRLHRLITNCPSDMVVDHIGGKFTVNDNRKSNLRIVSQQENCMNKSMASNNSSGVTGVRYDKRKSKWVAVIRYNKKTIYLGSFDNKDDAIKARKNGENKYFGEYSYDNSQRKYRNA